MLKSRLAIFRMPGTVESRQDFRVPKKTSEVEVRASTNPQIVWKVFVTVSPEAFEVPVSVIELVICFIIMRTWGGGPEGCNWRPQDFRNRHRAMPWRVSFQKRSGSFSWLQIIEKGSILRMARGQVHQTPYLPI